MPGGKIGAARPEERVGGDHFGLALRAQPCEIMPDQLGRREMALHEHRIFRAATERLDCQGAGPGEQVDRGLAANRRPQEIEQSLAEAVLHRPGSRVAGKRKFRPAVFAADDPHRGSAVAVRFCECPGR